MSRNEIFFQEMKVQHQEMKVCVQELLFQISNPKFNFTRLTFPKIT